MNIKKISCIICAFNEEKRISVVLSALKNHPYIDEIIVVDDGSTDKTKDIVKQFDFIKLISQEKNGGKSKAMARGIKESSYDTLLFLDADILSITQNDITELVKPIIEGRVDMSISLRKNSLLIFKMIGLDFVSGERVISKKYLIDQLEKIEELPGFGVEVFMNRIIIDNKLRIKIVKWTNVRVERKRDKVGFWKGTIGDFLMIIEIMKVISFKEGLLQNLEILKLSKKKLNLS
jgi:glycosyltransferase involved in cell wall biosynthesis